MTISRNALYLIIGALVVVTAVVGYQLYQERQKRPASRSASATAASPSKRSNPHALAGLHSRSCPARQ